MKTIILISCCKQKLERGISENFYQSTGFKKSLAYAKNLKPDGIFILSAKHHLVSLNQQLEYYEECLNDKTENEKRNWGKTVLSQLAKKTDLENDKFIILAGKSYYKYLITGLKNYELPLEGLALGYRLQWLDQHTVKENYLCENLHHFFNEQKRFSFPFDSKDLPENGIYILFEKGEKYKGMDRIVRVGTHTGQNNLRSRLEQHFINENKDRSIFRKNIGRALLNKANAPFLEYWNLDLTSKENRQKYSDKIDFEKQAKIERQVTEYIQKNFSFCVIPVDIKEERLAYEEYLIKTISSERNCRPSENWLGQYSPVEKIRKSGMWLINGLSKNL